MKILLGIAQCYLPEVVGGAQSSTHQLALFLRESGHDVAVASQLMGQGLTGLKSRIKLKVTRARTARDMYSGYPVYRGWKIDDVMPDAVKRVRPDVAILPTSHAVPVAHLLKRMGIPVIIYLRDVEFHELDGDLNDLQDVNYIANSNFTASKYKERFGINAVVVPPLFKAEEYRVNSSRKVVTFINPHPNKGVDIALGVAARCPNIPFNFISGWVLPSSMQSNLEARIAELPNVKLLPRTQDMRKVYEETKILLAPSQWEEAWGRVASEAHFSGIPVIGSQCGGLTEAIGPGGITIEPHAPHEVWAQALERLWNDNALYTDMVEKANEYAKRDQLNATIQLATVMGVIHDVTSRGAQPGFTRRAK
jgi:glycosyltransferase involved in cell wall biosynthesis